MKLTKSSIFFSLLFKLLLFSSSNHAGAFAMSDGMWNDFPLVLTVVTTPEVTQEYGASWDILKQHSRKIPMDDDDDAGKLELAIIVHNDWQLSQFRAMAAEDDLQFDRDNALTNYHLRNEQEQRHLQVVLNAEEVWMTNFSSCYKTVAQTFETMEEWAEKYPGWVTVETIGQSYLKQTATTASDGPGDDVGWDIPVAIVDIPNDMIQEKAPMMIVAGHHSRELTPPNTVMAWVEGLLASYGEDADVTWMLNRTAIHLVPIANPDGRLIVQNNLDWYYRKNARPNDCEDGESRYGTDLNRNYPMFWGLDSGSSNNTCSTAWRGTEPLSEPETQAVYDYVDKIFADDIKKGTPEEAHAKVEEACDQDAKGIFLDVHSAGDFVYYPWGFDIKFPPTANNASILTMATKLAFYGNYTLWGPGSDGFIYTVSGDATDTTYGQFCVPSYGYELGTTFYEKCEDWETLVKPIAFQSFMYAAKSAEAAYKLPLGPDVLTITGALDADGMWTASVEVSEEEYMQYHPRFGFETVASVMAFVDVYPMDEGAEGLEMTPTDGAFDSATEMASISIDTLSWSKGVKHMVYFQAVDSLGNAGPVSATYVEAMMDVDDGDESADESDADVRGMSSLLATAAVALVGFLI